MPMAAIIPLYAKRVSDLGPREWVVLECACGHVGMMTKSQLLEIPRVKPNWNVLGLQLVVRCLACRKKGRVMITVQTMS